MTLVSTTYVLDTSPFSRAGDMTPTLLEAQKAAVEDFVSSSVGERGPATAAILAMQSHPVQVCPHTNQKSVLLTALGAVLPERQVGPCRVNPAAALTAALLGHRQRPADSGSSAVIMFVVAPLGEAAVASLRGVVRTGLVEEHCALTIYLVGKYQEANQALLQPLEAQAPDLRVLSIPKAYTSIVGFIEQRAPGWGAHPFGDGDDNDEELQLALELSRQEYERERAAQAAAAGVVRADASEQEGESSDKTSAESSADHPSADLAVSQPAATAVPTGPSGDAGSLNSGIASSGNTADANTVSDAPSNTPSNAPTGATSSSGATGIPGAPGAPGMPGVSDALVASPGLPSPPLGTAGTHPPLAPESQNVRPARPAPNEDINIFGVSPNPWIEDAGGSPHARGQDALPGQSQDALEQSVINKVAGDLDLMDEDLALEQAGSHPPERGAQDLHGDEEKASGDADVGKETPQDNTADSRLADSETQSRPDH